MNQPSATELTVEKQAVEDRVAPDTLTEKLSVDLTELVRQGIDISFLAFFTRAGLEVSEEDLKRLCKLSRGEVQSKGYYFNLLAYDGLFPRRGELTDEECSRFLFMTQEEKPAWEAKLTELKAQREAQCARDELTEADTRNVADAPARQHRARVKPRTSYIAPSRVNTVSVIVPLEPELKKAVDEAVEQTGMSQKDFLTAAIQRAVEGRTTQTDPVTAKMTEEALEKTHELESLLSRVKRSLSTRTR